MYDEIKQKFEELEKKISSAEIISQPAKFKELSKEYGTLSELVFRIRKLEKIEKHLIEARQIEEKEEDEEYRFLAKEEIEKLGEKKEKIKKEIERILNPDESLIEKNAIVEIRAGVGGEEAELWARDLLEMYSKFFEKQKWVTKISSLQSGDLKGIKQAILEIKNSSSSVTKNIYEFLKNESGVHRVQRVPHTEKSGRIHTSTATIAVLSETEKVSIEINPKDLKIDTFCAGGHGGQNVNKVSTAIRITHLPTNLVVVCQDERTQGRNKEKAMATLRSRLLTINQEKQQKDLTSERKSQIGEADRSEKIRTYNFLQDRITDHRTNQSFHNLEKILEGNLEELISG